MMYQRSLLEPMKSNLSKQNNMKWAPKEEGVWVGQTNYDPAPYRFQVLRNIALSSQSRYIDTASLFTFFAHVVFWTLTLFASTVENVTMRRRCHNAHLAAEKR